MLKETYLNAQIRAEKSSYRGIPGDNIEVITSMLFSIFAERKIYKRDLFFEVQKERKNQEMIDSSLVCRWKKEDASNKDVMLPVRLQITARKTQLREKYFGARVFDAVRPTGETFLIHSRYDFQEGRKKMISSLNKSTKGHFILIKDILDFLEEESVKDRDLKLFLMNMCTDINESNRSDTLLDMNHLRTLKYTYLY